MEKSRPASHSPDNWFGEATRECLTFRIPVDLFWRWNLIQKELYGWWFQIFLCSLLGIWSNLTCTLMGSTNNDESYVSSPTTRQKNRQFVFCTKVNSWWLKGLSYRSVAASKIPTYSGEVTMGSMIQMWRLEASQGSCDVISCSIHIRSGCMSITDRSIGLAVALISLYIDLASYGLYIYLTL